MPLHDWSDDRGWDSVHPLWINALLFWAQERLPPATGPIWVRSPAWASARSLVGPISASAVFRFKSRSSSVPSWVPSLLHGSVPQAVASAASATTALDATRTLTARLMRAEIIRK